MRDLIEITDQEHTEYNDTVHATIDTRWHEMPKMSKKGTKLWLNPNIIGIGDGSQ